jgi:hypothetical protein
MLEAGFLFQLYKVFSPHKDTHKYIAINVKAFENVCFFLAKFFTIAKVLWKKGVFCHKIFFLNNKIKRSNFGLGSSYLYFKL